MRPFTLLYPAGGVLVSHIILVLLLVKALLPIVVTLLGMVTEVRDLQSSKALPPIFVTLLGMVTEVSALQEEYLQPIITQYFIDNKSEIWLLFLIAHSKR